MLPLESRLKGALYGLLIGDALGVPFEFHRPSELPPIEQIDFKLPFGFHRSHRAAPYGAWSDDGAQALCLLESLLKCGGLKVEDFARRMVAWYYFGHLAVNDKVFDVGLQTSTALTRIHDGVPVANAGASNVRANGNGSLMRVLPLALWHTGPDAELVELAHQQSQPTHAHSRSKICCALYCLIARGLLNGNPLDDSLNHALAFLQGYYAHHFQAELMLVESELENKPAKGSGYVVDTLKTALTALREPDYACVVRRAISFGHDTDTSAAVAGGLAGLIYGMEGIPDAWLKTLAGHNLAGPLIHALVDQRLAKDF